MYLSLGQLVGRAAEQYGEREALVSVEEGVRMSFEQLQHQVSDRRVPDRTLKLRRDLEISPIRPDNLLHYSTLERLSTVNTLPRSKMGGSPWSA